MSRLGQAMGMQRERKRSDFYPTIDRRAIPALLAGLRAAGDMSGRNDLSITPECWSEVHYVPLTYAEPCAGTADLIHLLRDTGLRCAWGLEIDPHDEGLRNRWPIGRGNALTLTERDLDCVDVFITNPPWRRPVLHQLIRHLASLRPTWLLFDASWAFTKQAAPFQRILTDVAAVGRLKWYEGSRHDPPDDCAWYRFCEAEADDSPPRLHMAVAAEREASPQGQLALA